MAHQHKNSGKNLALAFFLNLGFALVELAGGLITNSVAVLSDALHDFGDSVSLGLSWYLEKKSKKGANTKFTFGYRRFSLLGAVINSLILVAGSVFIVTEAVERFSNPVMPDTGGILILSLIGIGVNGFAAWKLSGGQSLNEKVVSWHLWEDVLGWIAVLVASVAMMFWQIPWLDPLLSIAISLFILIKVLMRLKDTTHVLLQGKPEGVDLEEIKESILQKTHVHSLHHTHLWTLDGQHHVFTTHIKLKNISEFGQIIQLKDEVKKMLADKYNFSHYTIETELDSESCELRG